MTMPRYSSRLIASPCSTSTRADLLAVRAGLVGHERHAEHLGRGLRPPRRALDDLDAAALAAPAGVNLRLDDDRAAAEPLRGGRAPRRPLNTTSPCGTGTPCFARMAFAWYS